MTGLFSRSELKTITGLTLSQITTAEGYGIITPTQDESFPGNRKYGYTWGDLVELVAYARLREVCKVRTITQAVETLSRLKLSNTLSDKRLLAYGDCLMWIDDTPDSLSSKIIELTGRNPGQIVFTFTYADLLEEIWDRGSVIHNFEKRAEDKPKRLAVA
jgi:hypothetical protein